MFTGDIVFKLIEQARKRVVPGEMDSLDALASLLNQHLREWLAEQPEVGHRCRRGSSAWTGKYSCQHERGKAIWCSRKKHDTHRARLVEVEKINGD